jgi:hypothetical protein
MEFFRSAALRRIIYALVLGLALTRLASRSHSEPLPPLEPEQATHTAPVAAPYGTFPIEWPPR